VKPRLIVQVEDPDKKVVWASEVDRRRVLDPRVAYLLTDALREALLRGTGQTVRQAGFQGLAAGKTGTTNDGTDAWFVGYDPQVVGTVWIGFDRPQPIMAQATGGRLAAPVWARIMQRFYAGRPRPRPWAQPDGVVAAVVDPDTGMVLAPGCQPASAAPYKEFFISSRMPLESCPSRGDIIPPLENYMDLETEVDEEIVTALPETEAAPIPPAPPEVEAEEAERTDGDVVEEPAPAPTVRPQPTPAPTAEPATEPAKTAEPAEEEPEPPAETASPAPSEPPL